MQSTVYRVFDSTAVAIHLNTESEAILITAQFYLLSGGNCFINIEGHVIVS